MLLWPMAAGTARYFSYQYLHTASSSAVSGMPQVPPTGM